MIGNYFKVFLNLSEKERKYFLSEGKRYGKKPTGYIRLLVGEIARLGIALDEIRALRIKK